MMKTLLLAAMLLAATPANARNIMNWECGPDKVTVDLTFTAPWKTVRHYYNHEITIVGLRDPVKDRVTFKPVTKIWTPQGLSERQALQGNSVLQGTG
jgi:hypothetical protein